MTNGVNSLNDIIMLFINACIYGVIGFGVIHGAYQLSTLVLLIGIFTAINRYLRNIK